MKTYSDSTADTFTSTMYLLLGDDPPPPAASVVLHLLKEWGWELSPEPELARLDGVEWVEAWSTDEAVFIVSLVRLDESMRKMLMLDGAQAGREEAGADAARAAWALRVETQWSVHYPMDSFRQQVQFCAPISIGWKVPLFDFNSTHLFSHEEVYDLAFSKVPPRATDLFVIHHLYPPQGAAHDGHWFHTHGLNRAGLPDFELLNVPARYQAEAGELVIATVDLLLGGGPPPLKKTIQVGNALKISLIEWERFVFQLPLEAVGGMHDRTHESGAEDFYHTGFRVAVVSQKPKGFFKKKWTLPLTVLATIAKGDENTIWKSTSESERIRILSNERWEIFRRLFAARKPEWKCILKLGRPVDAAATRHDYLWFDVLELEPDRVRGALRSQPFGSRKFKPGEEGWHPLDKIADWRIVTPEGEYGPEDAEELARNLPASAKSSGIHAVSPASSAGSSQNEPAGTGV